MKKPQTRICMNDSWTWTRERGLTVGERGGLGGRGAKWKKKKERNWDNCNRIDNVRKTKTKNTPYELCGDHFK